MRARSAAADLPKAGTRRDRLARALSEDWEPTRTLAERAGVPTDAASQVLLEAENLEHAEVQRVGVHPNSYSYEWRRGPRWESAYGGEG